MDVLAQYPRPQRLATAPGQLPKCVKTHGDLDNHVKAILDGLNHSGIWGDDSQVQCLRAEAVYAALGQRPQSSIRVYIPVGFATHLNQTTKDEPRDILETSAPGIDTGPADAALSWSARSRHLLMSGTSQSTQMPAGHLMPAISMVWQSMTARYQPADSQIPAITRAVLKAQAHHKYTIYQ